MVEFKIDDRKADIYFDGTEINLAIEVGAVINGIYQELYSQNSEAADVFKNCMQSLMEEDSPMWERSHSMTVVTVQK